MQITDFIWFDLTSPLSSVTALVKICSDLNVFMFQAWKFKMWKLQNFECWLTTLKNIYR